MFWNNTAIPQQIADSLSHALTQDGWRQDRDAFAAKEFMTVCGPKTAYVYLEDWDQSPSFAINCRYDGSLMNSAYVRYNATLVYAREQIAKFVIGANESVSDTYGVRIHKLIDPDGTCKHCVEAASPPIVYSPELCLTCAGKVGLARPHCSI